ncbi:N-acetylmuramoyl-L-alanine amidase [Nocardioides sp.]|uniref:N-acetylmuramoyl-L-alanine amidase n=1 Tax=Nocardioides sp. TaxID=35761 RepID=UPI001A17F13F|nr:N-acetylmuramoyl-L-alanine amidase [Nocardioides sp.]MBJ7357644.1 N-acetylmuramoyl-L-alanine amidase [Nocardioides sp.]
MSQFPGSATPSRRGFLLGSAALGASAAATTYAVPATAAATAATDASADLVLTGARGLRSGPITGHHFSMVGVTWRGGPATARLRVRTRSHGEWTGWRALRPLHDGPDGGGEGRPGLRATEPLWTGDCDAIDVRGADGIEAATLSLIAPGRDPVLVDPAARYERVEPGDRSERKKKAPQPDIVRRRAWGANEKWRNGGPWFNRTIQQVHVHHTVNSNDYAPEDVPALLRGIYRYHTKSLGWSDVGYNFLVDRFGGIWQGRAGGSSLPVLGAHTLGFNSTSTGIAVIGNFEEVRPERAVISSIVRLAAWKLDMYRRTPAGLAGVYSQGSDKFPSGQKVRLPVIDGHRDTNDTACPGAHLYAALPRIRERTQKRVDKFGPQQG